MHDFDQVCDPRTGITIGVPDTNKAFYVIEYYIYWATHFTQSTFAHDSALHMLTIGLGRFPLMETLGVQILLLVRYAWETMIASIGQLRSKFYRDNVSLME